ncbi:hypothetical protein BGW80DRAFT_498091 [Lactifluus volemus]|nr:hypothetical protein BGW80DRAFT_498091 [Lactifluus volemus]
MNLRRIIFWMSCSGERAAPLDTRSCVATSIKRKRRDGMSRLTSNVNWTCVRKTWKRFKMLAALGGFKSTSPPFPSLPPLSVNCSLARVLIKDPLTTEHYPDSLSSSHSEDACDASPNSHATFPTSQRDCGDVSNISTTLFPQRSPIQLSSVHLPHQNFELAQLMGSEISPAPILQEHREASLRRSQRQNAMIVTRYDSGDDQMV